MSNDFDKLKRGAVQILSEAELRAKLGKKKKLRIKLGVDPTAPDLHLGHTVTLNKLRQFQDQGHTVVFIIGDFTARIGDPSGRSETRPPMSAEEVERNARTYLAQVFKVLDESKTEVRRNSEWLEPLFLNKDADPKRTLLGVLSRHTVQQITEREDFSQRLKDGSPISLLELFYPLMQGYDSVAVEADVELGGSDQLFNLLMGRTMQKDAGQEPQVVMTLPLLEGTDGVKKMSKSYNNYIALKDEPADMFGKVMSISDVLMKKYYELLVSGEWDPDYLHAQPFEAKKRLAVAIIARYHGEAAAVQARQNFEKVFSRRETPEEMASHRVTKPSMNLVDLIVESGLAPSKNEARRLLQQGAVEWDGKRVPDNAVVDIAEEKVLKVGKRQFRKIIPA